MWSLQEPGPSLGQRCHSAEGEDELDAVNATVHRTLGQEYGVHGYPTIKYFAPGCSKAEEYYSGRTIRDIIKWAEVEFADYFTPPEIVQVQAQV